jgi:hypothetical protein
MESQVMFTNKVARVGGALVRGRSVPERRMNA